MARVHIDSSTSKPGSFYKRAVPEDFGEAWGSENDLAPPPELPLLLPVAAGNLPSRSLRPTVIVPGPLVTAPTSNAPLFTVGIAACNTPSTSALAAFSLTVILVISIHIIMTFDPASPAKKLPSQPNMACELALHGIIT
ncbi:hypothetical protein B0H14DRAFT_3521934 [Mycena olivaceomarginata]|nr:hypothetical protein B0H14DRAFT_3521934 [Mycena olivaceomarginata]